MGTRATIKFTDEHDQSYFVYRGHDALPEIVLPTLQRTIDAAANRWSGSEMGQLVSMFLGMTFCPTERIQDYELTHGFHGDESYRYFVTYNKKDRKWSVTWRG